MRRVRCRIENVFGIRKHSNGPRRVCCFGVAKAGLQMPLAAIAYNLRCTVSLLRDATT